MLSQLVPLFLALPLLSLAAGALAVHWTLKLRAATLKVPPSHQLLLKPVASDRMTSLD